MAAMENLCNSTQGEPIKAAVAIEKQSTPYRSWRRAGIVVAVLLTALLTLYWWRNGGRDQVVLALQPGFEVRQIDLQQKTMTVTRVNDTYLIACDDLCGSFKVGKSYAMFDRGGILEYRNKGRRISFPVLKEHIDFETPPGGHG
jgi:hypothetical protein